MTAISNSTATAQKTVALQEYNDAAAELRDLIDSGTLTGAELAEARFRLIRLGHLIGSVTGGTTDYFTAHSYSVFMRYARDTDAFVVRHADSTEVAADRMFGGPVELPPLLGAPVRDLVVGRGFVRDNLADGAALSDLFESDPEAFAAQWKKLDSDDRQMAMMALQNEMQSQAQLTNMLTSLLKTAHDGAMAIARNLAA